MLVQTVHATFFEGFNGFKPSPLIVEAMPGGHPLSFLVKPGTHIPAIMAVETSKNATLHQVQFAGNLVLTQDQTVLCKPLMNKGISDQILVNLP